MSDLSVQTVSSSCGPELVQNQYSLLARSDDHDVLPFVRIEGPTCTPFSPLATGLLAGRRDQAVPVGSSL